MGTKYTTQTISGYNASPPPDDGSTGSNNLLTWANHKSKLADPLKTLIENINTALVTALNFGGRTTAVSDSSVASDHMKTIECTAALTITLSDATTMGAGYVVGIANTGTGTVTINLTTATDTLSGVANGTASLSAGQSILYKTNTAATGYFITTSTVYTPIIRSQLSGCGMSTAGSSATMSIAAGTVTDSTNVASMNLSAIAKTTSAWSVGTAAGGLDTGSIATSTWYYFYVIVRTDTGVVDVVFSTSSSSPTLPANYNYYRYIGAGKTDGSSHWTAFTQMGREFWWSTPILEGGATYTGSGTAALITCTLPLGRKMKAIFNLIAGSNNNSGGIYISDPANADLAVSTSSAPLMTAGATNAVVTPGTAGSQSICWTNTSAQVRHRELTTNPGYGIVTLGWTDLADTNL